MLLDENIDVENRNTTDTGGEKSYPKTDIFIREISCWYKAVIKRWWWIIIASFLLSLTLAGFRMSQVPKLYISSCGLVRNEVADLRHSDLPNNYSPIQTSVILNMVKSYSCLTEVSRRLNMNLNHDMLFNIISVRRADKSSI